jgi:hypothetical protein
MLLLNISPALAGNLHETGANKAKVPGRVEVIFLKWITNLPNMAGVVSGDPGGGLFAGEILKRTVAGWSPYRNSATMRAFVGEERGLR